MILKLTNELNLKVNPCSVCGSPVHILIKERHSKSSIEDILEYTIEIRCEKTDKDNFHALVDINNALSDIVNLWNNTNKVQKNADFGKAK